MNVIQPVLELVGSLGFLLYGMKLMSDGIQKSAGERLQRALSVLTGNRFASLLTGLFVTMIVQSSGATTVMVVTFVNAGLMTLAQSVGVIFGANIGTTITAWIVAIFGFNFKISAFAIPVFGAGYFLSILRKGRYRNWAEALMGFGMLFLGLSGLSDVFTPEQLGWLFKIQGTGPAAILIGFVVGILITALLHSSSAFSAIVITMAYNGLVSWDMAAAMTLGSNIGSTIDAVLASLGANADARRSAMIHVMFNVFGTVLALIFFHPFLDLVMMLTPGGQHSNIAIRISMLHTVFKTLSTIVLLPLQNPLITLAKKIIKDDPEKTSNVYKLEFTGLVSKDNITTHIMQAEKAIADMTDVVTDMFDKIQIGVTKRNSDFIEKHAEASELAEDYADQMHEQITHYLIKCESLQVTEKQLNHISNMIQIVDELENMSDSCYGTIMLIIRSIEKKMKFQSEDMERLLPYIELARQFLQFIRININKQLTAEKLELARELEDGIDAFRKDLKKVARKRLEGGADVKSELLYIDIVRTIEHIGDNCFNISEILTNG
ncbi:phosphate:Na+ symporter [Treponema bryantii]|uniref:Phosphate:Na+ symporter n=1 Tax=Treponema bryantii TaxID=163 RepID=A0A1H9HPZ6_9SPIR|nr:Na/Pi cotransporter family protein [Treponema bryantii]BDC94398.1 phosphate:sodium symporter [Treponema bryantii]SEQ64302.1 phosphate:Na+ symporter [Treponema bryantii]